MNNTLPMKKEEGFWNRLKNKFFGIFSSKKTDAQDNVNNNFRTDLSGAYNEKQNMYNLGVNTQGTQPAQNANDTRNNNVNSDFRTELSREYNEKQRLYDLRRKYEADENYVNQMSDEDIKALTDLYNEETAEIYRKIDIEKKRRARQKPQGGN